MKNIIITLSFLLIILQGCKGGGYTVTTVYSNCNSPIELILKDSSQAFILDKSIIYVNQKTISENVDINGKFELCFGEECLGHYNPVQIQSNKVILTGKMRESSPKLLLSLFVGTHRDMEIIIDTKRVWVHPYNIETKFKFTDSNKTISFYKKDLNSPVTRFYCPSLNKEVLDWKISW